MAVWRRLAAESFPEIWRDEEARATPYMFFFALCAYVEEAHRAGNVDDATKAYAFATWCLRQRGKEPSNAAAVAFWEHVFDDDVWDLRGAVAPHIDARTRDAIWALWRLRLPDERLEQVRRLLLRAL